MKFEFINEKLHKKMTDNKGTTLVEMVVVFALLSIFMVSVTGIEGLNLKDMGNSLAVQWLGVCALTAMS